MTSQNNNDKDKIIIEVGEKIDISTSDSFKEEVLSYICEGYQQIVLDFSKVEMIDSFGLGKILLLNKELNDRGGELKIINVTSDYVKKMFDIIHLNNIIDM